MNDFAVVVLAAFIGSFCAARASRLLREQGMGETSQKSEPSFTIPVRLADGWWFPKASNPVPPPPPPPAPPTITEGCCRGNVKNEHFREMPKGPPPALQPKPKLTDEEREAVEWCLSLPLLDRDAVRMMPLRELLARLA